MKEVRLDIANSDGTNSVTYREPNIFSMSTHRKLWDGEPSVGNCVSGELDALLWIDTSLIPRNAKLTPYVRTDGGAWVKKSEFFVFSRSENNEMGSLRIVANDAIYKSESPFVQSGNIGNWPRTDISVMQEIATRTGTTICADTVSLMNKGYQVQFPGITLQGTTTTYKSDGTTTMREVAGRIASMYAGNWIIDNNGEWRLVVLGDIPAETYYLVTEYGNAITFGGVRILV